MPQKVGRAGQVINFNFITEFVAENLNKILYSTFTPGVLVFTPIILPASNEIEITEFSALIRPKNQNFLIKVDTMTSIKVVINSVNTYLIARMDWLTPPNGYDYESASYGVSGYSGYFKDDLISSRLELNGSITSLDGNHNLAVGDIVRFDDSKGGLVENTDYYVTSTDSLERFNISSDPNGTPFTTTSKTLHYLNFRKMNSHIVRFEIVNEDDVDSTYDIILCKILAGSGGFTYTLDSSHQTQVYLNDNCINYDIVQRSGVRTLEGTNSDYIDDLDAGAQRSVGNASTNIPISNNVMNVNLNAQFLNGITASDAPNSIGIKNGVLSKNMVTARLLTDNYEYAIGQSGIVSYSGFSGYNVSGWSGVSGYSAYSGYIPINNTILQTSLNAEYIGGYKVSDYSTTGHTHRLDEVGDGTTYAKISNIDIDGYVTATGMGNKALEYRHQSISEPFRYDLANKKKIFMLAGEIGRGGSSGVTFRKEFSSAPRVFLLNNETDEWKSIDESGISGTGFWVHHHDGTSGTSLVSDASAPFSTHWLAVGEIL